MLTATLVRLRQLLHLPLNAISFRLGSGCLHFGILLGQRQKSDAKEPPSSALGVGEWGAGAGGGGGKVASHFTPSFIRIDRSCALWWRACVLPERVPEIHAQLRQDLKKNRV